jgi:hypothetical protein
MDRNAATARFFVSGTGAGSSGPASLAALTASTWHYIVGRYTPDAAAAELKIWVDDTSASVNIGAVPTLFDGTAAFQIGAFNGAANFFDGFFGMAFLCACAVSDAQILAHYHLTRPLYGV